MVGRLHHLGLLIVLLLGIAASAGAQDEVPPRPQGLMWNRTGLPAVFPLQVKTVAGRDYLLTLIDAQTAEPALAAYIRGGRFFRVLVPPGTYRARFASGKTWKGEDELFGAGLTQVFELEEPLVFETRGRGTKAGHLITLPAPEPDQSAHVTIRDQVLCQSRVSVLAAPTHLSRSPRAAPAPHDPSVVKLLDAQSVVRFGPVRTDPYFMLGHPLEPLIAPREDPRAFDRVLRFPRHETRTRLCD